MKTDLTKCNGNDIGWAITFEVKLNTEEASKFDMEPIKYVGDYEIERQGNTIKFSCFFDKGELRENESIKERLVLIEKDIENMAKSCLN